MTHAWVVLTGPNGRDVSAPTEAQRASALAQVYRGGPGIDDEPPSAVLRFGYDDGLMYEIEVSVGGQIRYEEWSDRDCEIALASPRRMHASQNDALQMWNWLAQRQIAKIRALPWLSDN